MYSFERQKQDFGFDIGAEEILQNLQLAVVTDLVSSDNLACCETDVESGTKVTSIWYCGSTMAQETVPLSWVALCTVGCAQ